MAGLLGMITLGRFNYDLISKLNDKRQQRVAGQGLTNRKKAYAIVFYISNFTALSVGILDDVLLCTPYSYPSLWPCEIWPSDSSGLHAALVPPATTLSTGPFTPRPVRA